MVRDLEFESVQNQLDRQVSNAVAAVRSQECLAAPVAGNGVCRPAAESDFIERLNRNASRLGTGRLLLLDTNRLIVYDSGANDTFGGQISLVQSPHFTNVFEDLGYPYGHRLDLGLAIQACPLLTGKQMASKK